ncbi:MAG: PAS domain S-box protein [Candidatus Thorarchaeota archaeon]
MTLESLLHRDDIPKDVKGVIQLAITDQRKTEEDFLKTKTRLQFLLKSSPAVIFSCEPWGNFQTTFMSENVREITGYDAREFVIDPKFWTNGIHPDDKQRSVEIFEGIVHSEHYTQTYRFKHKNGFYLWMMDEATLIRDKQGNPIEIVGYWTDITKQKEAEEKLRKSEEEYRSLFENIPIGLYRSTPDHKFLAANATFIKQIGLASFEELLSIDPEKLAKRRKYDRNRFLDEINKTGEVKGLESELKLSNGTSINIRENTRAIRDSKGIIICYEGSVEDITDSVLAEKALIESEEKYRSLVDNLSDIVVEIDSEGNFTFISPQVVEVLGYNPEEEIGKSGFTFIHPDDMESALEVFQEILAGDQAYNFEYRVKHKDGHYVPISGSCRVIHENDDFKLISILRDITEKKKVEQALKESEEKYRKFFELAPISIASSSLDGQTFTTNQKTLEIMGYTEEELKRIDLKDTYVNPDDRNKILQELMSKGFLKDCEVKRKRKDGLEFDAILNAQIVDQGDEKIILSTMQDISHQKLAEEKLQRSEERYRMLFNESPISLWELDGSEVKKFIDNLISIGITDLREYFEIHPEEVKKMMKLLKIIDINSATLKLYKATNKEDLQDISVVSGEDSLAFKEMILSVDKQEYEIETVNYTRDGERIHVLIRMAIVPGHEEIFSKMIVSVVDITDRIKMIKALRESEEKYRILFNESPISLWEEDGTEVKQYIDNLRSTGIENFRQFFDNHPKEVIKVSNLVKILDVNNTTLMIYKAHQKEDLLQNLSVVFGEDSFLAFKEMIIALAEGRMGFEIDSINKTLTGEEIHVLLRLTVVPGFDQSFSRVIISILDITDRVEMEKALRESEERLRGFMDSATDSFLLLDSELNIIEANKNFSQGWNLQKHEFIGRNLSDLSERIILASPVDIVHLIKQLDDVTKIGGVYDKEFSVIHPTQGPKYFSTRAFKVGTGLGIISRDITQQKEAEMVRKELEQRRENFIYMTSHELRTPLTVISGYCDFLDKHDQFIDQDRRDKIISVMKSNVRRLERLTEDVVQVAQIVKEQFQVTKRKFDLCDFLLSNLDQYNQLLGNQFRFRRCNAEQSIIINADPDRLQQVLENVISNAIKHTSKEKREITVKLELQSSSIQIYISDNGAGIAREHLDTIFEQFISFQTEYAAGGTGIGLYLSRKILEAHGGTITAQSNGQGYGSTFIIELPID